MKILLDAGIFINAEIGEYASSAETVQWGSKSLALEIQGVIRKKLSDNPEFQKEKDALFTVGRLVREGTITPYRYNEVSAELSRGTNQIVVSALANCKILVCEPPIHRSKFRQTINFVETTYKGGKKDRKAGQAPSNYNQISTLTWLNGLTPEHVSLILEHQAELKLSPFEVRSFRELNWFKTLCARSMSPENYIDVFHLWTAERNDFALLTLDGLLKKLVSRVNSEKKPPVKIRTKVFSPTDLLNELGVISHDPVPLDVGRFYNLNELSS